MSTLPTQRDYRAVMLMAPAVHPTGPSGSFSVAGSMSFENLYMVNGVSVNENLRGQAQDLVIEDAMQETTVATAGVSANSAASVAASSTSSPSREATCSADRFARR